MATHPIKANHSSKRRATPAPLNTAGPSEACQEAVLPNVIHLGIDVHLRQHVVCRKIDAATVPLEPTAKPSSRAPETDAT